MAKKTRTDLYLDCLCGARSPVFQGKDSKWVSHYINCGRLTFWSNPMLTERLKYGGRLCPHNPEVRDCKNGKTSLLRAMQNQGFCARIYKCITLLKSLAVIV
jgi:hypothetical protein